MRVLHIDPVSGASGDMLLGALIDAGADLYSLNAELAKLGLPDARVDAAHGAFGGLTGTRASVPPESDPPSRTWLEIRAMIERAGFTERASERGLAIFSALADAEAAVHGEPVERVHFHEVGALDSIVDICGVAIALDLLGAERVTSGPLRLGGGMVRMAHGHLPVPAPATARLIQTYQAPIAAPVPGEETAGELLTPTGAAVICSLASFERPAGRTAALGVGFGTKTLPWPNMLRVWIIETEDADAVEPAVAPARDTVALLETNLDDMNPQHVEPLLEQLFAAGAVDAWITPITMKKGRPAVTVSAICQEGAQDEVATAMVRHSTTLGVRMRTLGRVIAHRRLEPVTTRWGDVRLKLRIWEGRVIDAMPEHDDCLRLSRETGVPIREIWNEAHRLGEPYVGRKEGGR